MTGKAGVAGLAASLWNNRTMQELDLGRNAIKSSDAAECGKALADAIKVRVLAGGRGPGGSVEPSTSEPQTSPRPEPRRATRRSSSSSWEARSARKPSQ